MLTTYFGVAICIAFVNCDCGQPGKSRSSSYQEGNRLDNVYKENDVIEYSCDKVLIGHYRRYCVQGMWTENIPKCGELVSVIN